MSAILTPVGLLLIILAGYLFKRFGLFGQKDYRVLQTAEFNIVLPGAIVYSFATNPHDISLLLISVFAFLFAFIPVVFIFLATRKRNVTDRAFLMLNGAGFNLGCFSFPVVQSFWGAGAVVPAAMFDIGNCVMVAAGTNVLTQQLLHIQPGKTLAEQHAGSAPTLPYEKPKDRDAKRLARPRIAAHHRQELLRLGAVRHVSAHDRVDRRQREDSRLDRLYNPAIERCQRAGVDADGGHAHGPAPIQA